MSGPKESQPGREEADKIDAAASAWVLRAQEGLDRKGEEGLDLWRAANPGHEEAYQRLLAMSAAFARARQTGASREIVSELHDLARRRRSRRVAAASAAIAAVLAVGAFVWLRPPSPRSLSRNTDSDRPPTTESFRRLSDGSLVEVDSNSEVDVHFEPQFRRVSLVRGNATFHVAKNPNRPFIVLANGIDVRAVGTAFNVKLEGDQVQVIVTEGKVGLDDDLHGKSLLPMTADGHPIPLSAGQIAVVEGPNPNLVRISDATAHEIDRRLGWQAARIDYDGVDLGSAVDQLNRRNRVQILIEDSSVAGLRLSGSFPAEDPKNFARIAAETFGLKDLSRGDDLIVLTRP